MESAPRYHPLAWIAAVALSAVGWAAHFDYHDFAGVLMGVFAIALVAWISARWVARLRRTPLNRSLAQAVQLSLSTFALVAFGLYAAVLHVLGFIFVYAEPTKNRGYAESAGIEFGPYIFLSFVLSLVVGTMAFLAIRALRQAEPTRKGWIWFCCLLGPAAWLTVAVGLAGVFREEQWAAFGGDLPSPLLFTISFVDYRFIPVVVAFGLLGLAWFWRSRAERFRWLVVAQLFVALAGSAFLTFAGYSAASMLFSMCGGAI